MYCRKCGNELGENIKFCPICGEKVFDTQSQKNPENNSSNVSNDQIKGVFCTKCYSSDLDVITETNTQTTGGGYSAGKGCLGAMLFGPLGALCGSCGSSVHTTQNTKTYFVCKNCGNKFRIIDDELKEVNEQIKQNEDMKKGGTIGGIIAAIILFFSVASATEFDSDILLLEFFIVAIICAVVIVPFNIFSNKNEEKLLNRKTDLEKQLKEYNLKIADIEE